MEKLRRVEFTPEQMIRARHSGKFEDTVSSSGHRLFVEWMFKTQHKCIVEDHSKLIYDYRDPNKICIEGLIGHAIVQL